jgi:hypothetical protein
MKTQTQTDRILAVLKRGHRITPIVALSSFGCFRLGARIYDLRKLGYNIAAKKIPVGFSDPVKYVSEYWMPQ